MFWKKKEIPPLTKDEALAFLATQDLSVEDLSELAIKTLDPLFTNERLTKQDEFNLFEKISEIEGVEEYMRDTMSRDVKRFFAASPDAQPVVRGAYLRTLYFRSLLNRKSPTDAPNKMPQITSDRYAVGAD